MSRTPAFIPEYSTGEGQCQLVFVTQVRREQAQTNGRTRIIRGRNQQKNLKRKNRNPKSWWKDQSDERGSALLLADDFSPSKKSQRARGAVRSTRKWIVNFLIRRDLIQFWSECFKGLAGLDSKLGIYYKLGFWMKNKTTNVFRFKTKKPRHPRVHMFS